eukprot:COSAG05_NODE_297_length_11939_cov_17.362753_14_plen_101_part_00
MRVPQLEQALRQQIPSITRASFRIVGADSLEPELISIKLRPIAALASAVSASIALPAFLSLLCSTALSTPVRPGRLRMLAFGRPDCGLVYLYLHHDACAS